MERRLSGIFENPRVYKVTRLLILALLLIYAIGVSLLIDFYTPTKRLVTINGGEVKRVDKDGIISANNPADGPTRDVFFVFTSTEENTTLVYRNEDTGWGFPPYFKFNSADLQANINILDENKSAAIVSSYGWRIQMLSMFPNILKIQSDDALRWSIVRILFFTLHLVGFGLVAYRLRRWFLNRH